MKYTIILFTLTILIISEVFADMTDAVFKVCTEADANITIQHAKDMESLRIDIGVGKLVKVEGVEGELRDRTTFQAKDLVSYFRGQKHKKLITVRLDALQVTGEARANLVKEIISYFKQAGYKRIVVFESSMSELTVLKEYSSD
jgi:hypothetical protein